MTVDPNISIERAIEVFQKNYQDKLDTITSKDYNPYVETDFMNCSFYTSGMYHFEGEKLAFLFEDPLDLQLVQTYISLRLSQYYGFIEVEILLDTLEEITPVYEVNGNEVVTWETLDYHVDDYVR